MMAFRWLFHRHYMMAITQFMVIIHSNIDGNKITTGKMAIVKCYGPIEHHYSEHSIVTYNNI